MTKVKSTDYLKPLLKDSYRYTNPVSYFSDSFRVNPSWWDSLTLEQKDLYCRSRFDFYDELEREYNENIKPLFNQ